MEGDFFLFKFSYIEDFKLVWNFSPFLLNEKPFIFTKWSSNFWPIKENIAKILIWIKMSNFPLCSCNDKGSSKIASKVGVPLPINSLTINQSWITFVRVYEKISPSSLLSDEISLSINGSIWKQSICYDCKPKACLNYNTLFYDHPHVLWTNKSNLKLVDTPKAIYLGLR